MSVNHNLPLENFFISEDGYPRLRLKVNIENAQWLEPLRPFTAVKNTFVQGIYTAYRARPSGARCR